MNTKKVIAFALALSLILTIVSSVSAVSKAESDQSDLDIYFSSKVDMVSSTNRIFSVTYELTQNRKGVVGAGFDLKFDSSIVEVVEVENFYDVFTEFNSYSDFTYVNDNGCLKISAFQQEFGDIATQQSGKLVAVQFKLKSDVSDSEIIDITPQIIDGENYLIDDEVNQVNLTAGVQPVSFKFIDISAIFEPTTTVTTTEPTTTLPNPDLSQDDEYELAFSATPYLIDQQERTFKVVYTMFLNTNKAVGTEFRLNFDNTVCELQEIEAYTTLFTENTGFKKIEEINESGSIYFCGLQKNYGDYVKETYGEVLTVYFKLKDGADADNPVKITPVVEEYGNYSIDYSADIPAQIYLKTYVEEVSFTVGTLTTEPVITTTTTSDNTNIQEVTTTTLGNTDSTQTTSTTEQSTNVPSESVATTTQTTTGITDVSTTTVGVQTTPTTTIESQTTPTTTTTENGIQTTTNTVATTTASEIPTTTIESQITTVPITTTTEVQTTTNTVATTTASIEDPTTTSTDISTTTIESQTTTTTITTATSTTTFTQVTESQTTTTNELKGDTNGDGKISVADARKIVVAIAKGAVDDILIGDVNGDGKISVADARKIVVAIAKGQTEF